MKLIILNHRIVIRDGISQNWYGRNIRIKSILNQFNDKFIEVDGSKIEKIFIIFNFNYEKL